MQINEVGRGTQTLLEVFVQRCVSLHHGLELVAGVKSDHVARLDRDGLAGARVATGPRRLAADVEVAEARQLHVLAVDQVAVHQLEEGANTRQVTRGPIGQLFDTLVWVAWPF